MSKKRKLLLVSLTIIISMIIIAILLILILIGPLIGSNGVFMPKYDDIETDFDKNYNSISLIGEYIYIFNSDYIRWNSLNDDYIECYYNDNGEHKVKKEYIYDDELIRMKNELKNNYKCIIKENNYIMFVKWSSLDSSCGIVYCREPQNMNNMFNDGEKDIIKLSKPNWYYFKHIGD